MLWVNALLIAEGTMTRIEQEFIRWLSVAGGFGVGFVVTHIVLKVLSGFVFKTVMPARLLQLLRIGGGIAAAILVYFLLLPSGGNGPGGAGNDSILSSKSTSPAEQTKQKTEEPKKEPSPVEKKVLAFSDEMITVTVLAPNPDQKWYLYADGKEPQTEKMILDRIAQRDKPGEKPIKVVQIVVTENSSVPAIVSLMRKVKTMGKKVLVPPELEDLN